MALEFEWDLEKAAENLAKHKVSFEGATTVFGDPLGRIMADPRHSFVEERLVLLGRSEDRRLLAGMHVEKREAIRIISARQATRREQGTMKKPRNRGKASKPADADEILPEYDFSRARRNPYASRYTSGSVVVVLEPDVAAAFPGSAEANQALRALAGIIEKHRSRAPVPRRRS